MPLWEVCPEIQLTPSPPADLLGAKLTANVLAHTEAFLGLSLKINISKHYRAPVTEKENGPESVFDGSGINLAAVGI